MAFDRSRDPRDFDRCTSPTEGGHIGRLAGCLCLLVSVAASDGARAASTVWNVDCLGNPTMALGQVVGTATTAGSAADGDKVLISGICTEDVTVTQNRLTITNHLQLPAYVSTDGVQGQLEIASAKTVLLSGMLLGIASGTFSFNDPGDAANLLIHDGAMATVQYCEILNGPLNGIMVSGGAVAEITNTTVSGNGTAGVTGMNSGIKVTERSTLILGGTGE